MSRTAGRAGMAIRAMLIALGVAAIFLAAGPVAASSAPATPSSVSTSRADGTLTASWSAPSGAETYHVTYSSTGGASWELAALDHPASGSSGESITFSVSNSDTYIVGVRAKNTAGGSGWRNSPPAGPYTPTLTPTPAPPSPPGTPSSVSVTRADGDADRELECGLRGDELPRHIHVQRRLKLEPRRARSSGERRQQREHHVRRRERQHVYRRGAGEEQRRRQRMAELAVQRAVHAAHVHARTHA